MKQSMRLFRIFLRGPADSAWAWQLCGVEHRVGGVHAGRKGSGSECTSCVRAGGRSDRTGSDRTGSGGMGACTSDVGRVGCIGTTSSKWDMPDDLEKDMGGAATPCPLSILVGG